MPDDPIAKVLSPFPAPLLTELIEGRWLPIVGAGMSANAMAPDGHGVPMWDGLARAIAKDISGYSYVGALDAISAYEQTYGRRELVNRLHRELLVGVAIPGDAHAAFCRVRFDRVITTNIEFLLEDGYNTAGERFEVLIDEDQLPIPPVPGSTLLMKLHGDLRHPKRLVMTEDDYDGFLSRYPVLATHLSSLLIERVPVFVGYSLDDPDFRQILATLKDRLGKMLPTAYVIAVDATAQEIARYDRRGVKVVNLPRGRGSYGAALANAFSALDEFWKANVLQEVRFNDEAPLEQIRTTPRSEASSLCYFSIPVSLRAFYRDEIFPLAEQAGLVPISGFDVDVKRGSRLAATRELIQRSGLAVIDMSEGGGSVELGVVLDTVGIENVLVVSPTPPAGFSPDTGIQVVLRPASLREDRDAFLDGIAAWFDRRAVRADHGLNAERLLGNKEWAAALIAAVSELEVVLRERLSGSMASPKMRGRRFLTLRQMISESVLDDDLRGRLLDWVALRNGALHESATVRRAEAQKAVSDVRLVRDQIEEG